MDYRPKLLTAKASFSRSLHNLIHKKEAVEGMALAWVAVGSGCEDIASWQGGGRKKGKHKHDVPRFKLLSLTDSGWSVARELLGPDIGKCCHTKRRNDA